MTDDEIYNKCEYYVTSCSLLFNNQKEIDDAIIWVYDGCIDYELQLH
jgi:hypothetical protein